MTTPHATIIFTGPSLAPAEAASLLPEALIKPPAQRGDIYRAVKAGAGVIGLIDGYYEHVPPPWHKEILHALDAGCRVVGAASMGAIRSAELGAFGMEGIGDIYQLFEDGLFSDADVSLSHGPAPDYRPLSEAIANIYFTLKQAQRETDLSARDAARLLATARSIFYSERSYQNTVQAAVAGGMAPDVGAQFLAYAELNAVHQKRADALALVHKLAENDQTPNSGRPQVNFNRTAHYFDMCDEEDALATDDVIDRYAVSVVDELRLQPMLHDRTRTRAQLASIARRLAQASGVELTQQIIDETSDQIRTELGLFSPELFAAWLKDSNLSLDDYTELVERRALAHWGLQNSTSSIPNDQLVIDELRLSGELQRLVERSSAKASMLRDGGYDEAGSTVLREADEALVLAWFFTSHLSVEFPVDVDRYAATAGYSSREELVRSARREYRFAASEPTIARA